MKLRLIIFYLFISTVVTAQDSIVIQGEFLSNSRYAKVVLKKFNVGTEDLIAVPINSGKFKINLPKTIIPGVYRLQYGQNDYNDHLDIIVDGKEKHINLILNLAEPAETRIPIFNSSELNLKWYDFLKIQGHQLKKITALQNALWYYNNDAADTVIKSHLLKAINIEKNSQQIKFNHFVNNNLDNWAGYMVKNTPIYFVDYDKDLETQKIELQEHFWDFRDTNNPLLINSPLYTDQILNFLNLYILPLTLDNQTKVNDGLFKGVNIVLDRFSNNEITRDFVFSFLQMGFKELGNETLLKFVDQLYYQKLSQCNEKPNNLEFEKRMVGYESLKNGKPSPEIKFNIPVDNFTSLYDINASQTIIVFWSSWCPHCLTEMPKVNQWSYDHPETKILAVSLDSEPNAFNATKINYPNMLHYCDFKQWEGKAASDYYVYGTPTFILLDKDKLIKGKFSSFNEILNHTQ